MASFFSYWHRAIGSKGPPEILTSSDFIGICRIRSTWDCFDHISLIRTQNHASFLLLDSLLIEEFFENFENFLATDSTGLETSSSSSTYFG